MRLRASLALLAATAVLAAGCGGTPEPKPMPKKSSTPSASAAATPPALPEEAREKSKEGAIATTRHFLEAMDYAGATGDTKSFDATYLRDCTRCRAIAVGIRKTYSNGGRIDGGAWEPQSFKAYALEGNLAFVDAVVDYEAQTYVAERGADPVTSSVKRGVLKTFELRWKAGMWRVAALDPEA